MGSKVKGVKKSNKPTRGKAPGGRVYEVAQAILSAPEGGVAAVIRAALNDKEAPIRRDPRAFTMFSTRCRKKGEWAKCVEIFDAMRDQGIETNTIVHNATMSACSKGGDWERALELFDAMPGEGHERSTITYNVAMGACMRGGDWERALELFDEMETEGLERDHVSVNTAMAAAEAGGDAGKCDDSPGEAPEEAPGARPGAATTTLEPSSNRPTRATRATMTRTTSANPSLASVRNLPARRPSPRRMTPTTRTGSPSRRIRSCANDDSRLSDGTRGVRSSRRNAARVKPRGCRVRGSPETRGRATRARREPAGRSRHRPRRGRDEKNGGKPAQMGGRGRGREEEEEREEGP